MNIYKRYQYGFARIGIYLKIPPLHYLDMSYLVYYRQTISYINIIINPSSKVSQFFPTPGGPSQPDLNSYAAFQRGVISVKKLCRAQKHIYGDIWVI